MTDSLQLIETETLVRELMDRFSAIVIIGVQQKTGRKEDTYYHNYSGGMGHCIGLARMIEEIIKKDYFTNNEELGELP